MTTLPKQNAGERWEAGRRFTIRGQKFDRWPSEVVLSIREQIVLTEVLPSFQLLKLVEKTDNEMVFEATASWTYGTAHVWSVFATPYEVPRQVLNYMPME